MSKAQSDEVKKEIETLIIRCKKAYALITKGTSQETLLANRLFVLEIALSLCKGESKILASKN